MEEEIVRSIFIRSVQMAVLTSAIAGMFWGGCAAEDVSVAAHVATMPSRTLQLILADPTHPDGQRWIVWDKDIGETQTAHIALCDMAGKCQWSHTWPDAYGPTIQYMGSWSTQKASLFLIIYNEGAETQTAVGVELLDGQPPHILDQYDGAWIGVAPGEDYLELSTASGAIPLLKCLSWNRALLHLYDVGCHSHHVEEK